MRVATNAYTDSMLNQFNALAARQYALQSQASTGLRVQAPADDPVAMQDSLKYAAEKSKQGQYLANISTLQSRANLVNGALQSLQTASTRAGEIATSAGDATTSDFSGQVKEVNDLINQVVTAANTKDPSTGQYLFAGTASGTEPFITTKDANGNVISVTYNGNSTVNQSEIGANLTTSVDVPGVNNGASGTRGLIADQQSGADFINHLISLRDNLQAGNKSAISSTDHANLLKDENNIAYQVAHNGVQLNQLSAASAFATNTSHSLDQMISNTASADLVSTMVQLNQAQTAYQAALSSGAKIMSLSLLNYLH